MTGVLVDSSVWSLLLRRPPGAVSSSVDELRYLLRNRQAQLLGVVRQELLSGIRHHEQFIKLRDYLQSEPDYPVLRTHYELAAEYCNTCRQKGVQGSSTDFLICAVGALDGLAVFTSDQDFSLFARILPIKLHRAQQAR